MEVKRTRSSSANYSNTSSSSTLQTCTDEDLLDVRRGPWMVEEDFKLINYIANHGEGRWNSLARSAGNHFTLFFYYAKEEVDKLNPTLPN